MKDFVKLKGSNFTLLITRITDLRYMDRGSLKEFLFFLL